MPDLDNEHDAHTVVAAVSENKLLVAATLTAIFLAGSAIVYRTRPLSTTFNNNKALVSPPGELVRDDDDPETDVHSATGAAAASTSRSTLDADAPLGAAKDAKPARSKDRRRRGKDTIKDIMKSGKKLKALNLSNAPSPVASPSAASATFNLPANPSAKPYDAHSSASPASSSTSLVPSDPLAQSLELLPPSSLTRSPVKRPHSEIQGTNPLDRDLPDSTRPSFAGFTSATHPIPISEVSQSHTQPTISHSPLISSTRIALADVPSPFTSNNNISNDPDIYSASSSLQATSSTHPYPYHHRATPTYARPPSSLASHSHSDDSPRTRSHSPLSSSGRSGKSHSRTRPESTHPEPAAFDSDELAESSSRTDNQARRLRQADPMSELHEPLSLTATSTTATHPSDLQYPAAANLDSADPHPHSQIRHATNIISTSPPRPLVPLAQVPGGLIVSAQDVSSLDNTTTTSTMIGGGVIEHTYVAPSPRLGTGYANSNASYSSSASSETTTGTNFSEGSTGITPATSPTLSTADTSAETIPASVVKSHHLDPSSSSSVTLSPAASMTTPTATPRTDLADFVVMGGGAAAGTSTSTSTSTPKSKKERKAQAKAQQQQKAVVGSPLWDWDAHSRSVDAPASASGSGPGKHEKEKEKEKEKSGKDREREKDKEIGRKPPRLQNKTSLSGMVGAYTSFSAAVGGSGASGSSMTPSKSQPSDVVLGLGPPLSPLLPTSASVGAGVERGRRTSVRTIAVESVVGEDEEDRDVLEDQGFTFPTLNPTMPPGPSRTRSSLGDITSPTQPSHPNSKGKKRPGTPSHKGNTPSSSHRASVDSGSGMPAVSTQTQLASLRGALEAARLREEKHKADMEKSQKEMEVLRWESATSRRGEAELQAQVRHLSQQIHHLQTYASFFAGMAPHVHAQYQQQMMQQQQQQQQQRAQMPQAPAAEPALDVALLDEAQAKGADLDAAEAEDVALAASVREAAEEDAVEAARGDDGPTSMEKTETEAETEAPAVNSQTEAPQADVSTSQPTAHPQSPVPRSPRQPTMHLPMPMPMPMSGLPPLPPLSGMVSPPPSAPGGMVSPLGMVSPPPPHLGGYPGMPLHSPVPFFGSPFGPLSPHTHAHGHTHIHGHGPPPPHPYIVQQQMMHMHQQQLQQLQHQQNQQQQQQHNSTSASASATSPQSPHGQPPPPPMLNMNMNMNMYPPTTTMFSPPPPHLGAAAAAYAQQAGAFAVSVGVGGASNASASGPSSVGSMSPEAMHGSPSLGGAGVGGGGANGKKRGQVRHTNINTSINGVRGSNAPNGRLTLEDIGDGWLTGVAGGDDGRGDDERDGGGVDGVGRDEDRDGDGAGDGDGDDDEEGEKSPYSDLLADAILKRPGSIRGISSSSSRRSGSKKGSSGNTTTGSEGSGSATPERVHTLARGGGNLPVDVEFTFPSLSDLGNVPVGVYKTRSASASRAREEKEKERSSREASVGPTFAALVGSPLASAPLELDETVKMPSVGLSAREDGDADKTVGGDTTEEEDPSMKSQEQEPVKHESTTTVS